MNSKCYLHSSGPVASSTRSSGKAQIASFENDQGAAQTRESDKPIPFLRRLIDMLQDNESVISFHPGVHVKIGQHIPGRIVVHDRSIVESEILPRYFNHASFASLRRQLNYFAFTRVGKGKQRGATYCNEKVINLLDILTLKRRVVGSTTTAPSVPVIPGSKTNKGLSSSSKGGTSGSSTKKDTSKRGSSGSISPSSHAVSVDSRTRSNTLKNGKSTKQPAKKKKTCRKAKRIIDSVVPVVHLPLKRTKVEGNQHYGGSTGGGTTNHILDKALTGQCKNEVKTEPSNEFLVSISPPPADNPPVNLSSGGVVVRSEEPQITLDLTKPPSSYDNTPLATLSSFTKLAQENKKSNNTREADVLAGCSALLALGCQSS